MPLFSVIIPAFNRAALIGRTLRSVLDQADQDIELIVVDDGSTDGTPAAVQAFGPRVRLLQQANRGPGAARNLGLRAASGEYVAFLDSDDVWFPWTAHTYARTIQHFDRPAFIAGKPLIFTTDSDFILPSNDAPDWKVFDDYYASGDQWRWFSASSFVMRRDLLLSAGGFTDEWVNGEDADAAMRLGTAGRFVQITSPHTFAYRQHTGSAMSDLDRTLRGVRYLIEQEEMARYPGGPQRATERQRIISFFARPVCIELLKRGQPDAARSLYRRTFRWNVKLGRWKFLGAFTALAAISRLRGRSSSSI